VEDFQDRFGTLSRLKFVAIARGSKLGGQVGPAGVGL
jgi:hypothetical protein